MKVDNITNDLSSSHDVEGTDSVEVLGMNKKRKKQMTRMERRRKSCLNCYHTLDVRATHRT